MSLVELRERGVLNFPPATRPAVTLFFLAHLFEEAIAMQGDFGGPLPSKGVAQIHVSSNGRATEYPIVDAPGGNDPMSSGDTGISGAGAELHMPVILRGLAQYYLAVYKYICRYLSLYTFTRVSLHATTGSLTGLTVSL